MDPLLNEYLGEKRLSCTPRTMKNYECFLNQYSRYLGAPLSDSRREDVSGFLARLQGGGYTRNSLNTIQTCLICFYEWAWANEKIPENPCRGLSRIKRENRAPVYLTREEVQLLIDQAEDMRENLIVRVLYVTGVRVSELVGIRKHDVDLANGDVKVHGKGNKDRLVNISSPQLLEDLHWYIHGLGDDDRVFKLHMATVERKVKKLASMAGINKTVTPHKLRHSFATHLYQSGGKLIGIQKLLGHTSLNTTQIYTHYSLDEQREMLRNSPMASV